MAQQLDTNPTGKSDYRTTIEVADGETSEWYIVASETKFVAVELETAGTASIEATLDIKGAIAEPPTAVGVAWPAGVTTGNIQDVAVGGTAIRLVSAAGAAKMYANASKA